MGSTPWLVDLTLIATPGYAFTYQHEEALKGLSPDLFPQVIRRTTTLLNIRLRMFADTEANAREGAERIIAGLVPHESWTIAHATARRDFDPHLKAADAMDDEGTISGL